MIDPIDLYTGGDIPAGVAVSRLILNGENAQQIRDRILTSGLEPELLAPFLPMIDLERLQHLAEMLQLAALDHGQAATPEAIGAAFDRAARLAPEASMALYCLGIDTLIHEATQEIVDFLYKNGCLDPFTDALDLGCGIGRVTRTLSRHIRSIVGVDVSDVVLRAAEEKSRNISNLRYQHVDGYDLRGFADGSIDLVLAIDTFPYLVQSDLGKIHVLESRRLLRPSGSLVICNLSYRSDLKQDEIDARTWAEEAGFSVASYGRPFRLWDAHAWILSCI